MLFITFNCPNQSFKSHIHSVFDAHYLSNIMFIRISNTQSNYIPRSLIAAAYFIENIKHCNYLSIQYIAILSNDNDNSWNYNSINIDSAFSTIVSKCNMW